MNDQNSVLLLLHTRTLLIMAVRQWGETALYKAAYNNLTDLAEVLLAANAAVDIMNKVRACCSWLGAGY